MKRLADEVASKESKGIHLLVNNGRQSGLALRGELTIVQLVLPEMIKRFIPTASRTLAPPRVSPSTYGRVSPRAGRRLSKPI